MRSLVSFAVFAALQLLQVPARAEKFMDWRVEADEDGLPYMFTMNDSGGLLGKWCDAESDSCYWVLLTRTSCQTGITTPVLVNSEGGSYPAQVTCAGKKELGTTVYFRYAFNDPDKLDTVFPAAAKIGIAIPIDGDGFRVVRFSGIGASVALSRWQGGIETYLKRRPRSTKDTRL